jgi:hypothetical protein
MAIAANDLVIVNSPVAFALPVSEMPLTGRVESAGPSVVAWANGKRTTYTDSTLQLAKVLASPVAAPLLNQRVLLGAGFPNPGQRNEGIVVAAFALETDGAVDLGDFVIVRTDDGMFIFFPAASVTIVQSS